MFFKWRFERINFFFQTVSRFGGIDILVSNAAANPVFGPILDVSTAKIRPSKKSL